MKFILIIAIALLCGCSRPMTNDEVIAAIKKCKDAGLNVNEFSEGLTNNKTTDIQCSIHGQSMHVN